MKGWVILGLAALGGYVALKWFFGQRMSSQSGNANNPVQGGTGNGALAAATGVGDFYVSPLASGIPAFDQSAIANGHGDQVAAAAHANAFSTLNGSPTYEPAFGPMTNQNEGTTIYLI